MGNSLIIILNEILLALLAIAVFSLSLVRTRPSVGRGEVLLTVAGLSGLLLGSFVGLTPCASAFGGAYQVGAVAIVFKRLFLMAGLLMALLSWPGPRKRDVLPYHQMGEYLGLMLLSLSGMCLLVSSQELVFLYVSLELVTIPVILLVALHRRESRTAEAAIKYVLFSSLSSGLLLYGLSLVYGMTGTTLLGEIGARITFSPLAVVALLMVTAGVGFKISAVPFHMWTPDVYEGAPVTVTTFLSVASKAAGFALYFKVIAGAFAGMGDSCRLLASILACLTMTFGNLVALHQTNMKRFLAFSSIAQAGYLLIGLTNEGELGLASVTYYLLVYLFSNVAAFAVVTVIASGTGKEDMREYAGLSETNPHLALVMMLAMFSLAGIPPLAGFLGKFYLFAAAAGKGLYWLVFVGAINATISLYYYLGVVKWMYIMKPSDGESLVERIAVSWPSRIALISATAAILLIGVLPQIIRWTETAASTGF